MIARSLPLSAARRWSALAALSIASAVGILFFCLPQPQRIARILDAEVRGCQSPEKAAEAATAGWEKRIAAVTWSRPREDWKSDVARMLQAEPGVVLDVHVMRSRDIYENRKPWNQGTRFAEGWLEVNEEQRFFGRSHGAMCERYLSTGRQIHLPSSDGSNAWPPDRLANYLGLQVLEAVPVDYQGFAGE